MTQFRWLAVLGLVAGCGFGDNNVTRGTRPDAGSPAHDACSNCATHDAPVPHDAQTVAACTLLPQAGCGSGDACDLTAADDGTVGCRDVTSQGTANNHCAVDTACRAGYTCVHDGANSPWCSRFCDADAECDGTGSRCVDQLVDHNNQPLDVFTCSNACDPYGQSGCPTGMGCLGFDDGNDDFSDCEYMTNKPDGAACTDSEECTPGAMCVTSNNVKTCRPTCIAGNDNTCADVDTVCDSFTSPLIIGGIEYGACE